MSCGVLLIQCDSVANAKALHIVHLCHIYVGINELYVLVHLCNNAKALHIVHLCRICFNQSICNILRNTLRIGHICKGTRRIPNKVVGLCDDVYFIYSLHCTL